MSTNEGRTVYYPLTYKSYCVPCAVIGSDSYYNFCTVSYCYKSQFNLYTRRCYGNEYSNNIYAFWISVGI